MENEAEIKWLSQDYTSSKWQNQNLNPDNAKNIGPDKVKNNWPKEKALCAHYKIIILSK